ncbi:MAG: alkaline phosphatase family protein [Deltaproteobacteria bacterium]|jgi:hypothetical protein|nr:alkaline phosphatase family protein [Deltaproteobacteria bacterium]MBW2532029.1 alkaline phosphatase family protein [Deltaproteobacteria bacterium]
MSSKARRLALWAVLLPLLLTLAYLRVLLGGAATRGGEARSVGQVSAECEFPGRGADRQRLVIAVVDSLRAETALDPAVMPWLSQHARNSVSGRMTPCLSQLTLLCMRTMFEGSEPLLATGFYNFSGMKARAPSLVQRLAARGVRIAAVADQPFITLYRASLAEAAMFKERPSELDRDAFGRQKTFEWLADPSIDVILSLVIDTDAFAHRYGVGAPEYVEKFKEADSFLLEIADRLGPRDSMIVLGDHGHSLEGHHSAGIPADTLVVASGPWFPQRQLGQVSMASTYFLAGAVTCETTPPLYTGEQPFDALSWPASTREAFRAGSPPPSKQGGRGRAGLGLDIAALAMGMLLLFLLLGAERRAIPRGPVLVTTVGLGGAAVVQQSAIVVITAVGVAALLLLRRPVVSRRVVGLSALALVVGLAGGLAAPQVLVTLQNNVNPSWTIGLWTGLVAVIIVLSFPSRWLLGLPWPIAFGFTGWAVALYAMFFGPYYYGAVRLAPFGLIMLLGGFVAAMPRGRRLALLPWVAVATLSLIPILFPVMKEWNPRWVALDFVQDRGPLVVAAASLGALAIAAAITRDWRAWTRPAVAIASLVAIGVATELAEWTLLAAVLVMVAFVGWARLTERLEEAHPTAALLAPIGQATFALVMLFVLLGGLRFAGVDFHFALAWSPVEAGEARALALAVPLCIIKYVGPIGLLLWLGPPVARLAPTLVLLRLVVAGAGLLGMQLTGSPSLALFRQLQAQELALTVAVFATVAVAHLARRPAPVAEEGIRSARSPRVFVGAGARVSNRALEE